MSHGESALYNTYSPWFSSATDRRDPACMCGEPKTPRLFAELHAQISSTVFGLPHTVIHCSESTKLDDFREGLLIQGNPDEEDSSGRSYGVGFESAKVGSNYLISFSPYWPFQCRSIVSPGLASLLSLPMKHPKGFKYKDEAQWKAIPRIRLDPIC